MKFLLLIYGDEKAWENASEAEQAKMMRGTRRSASGSRSPGGHAAAKSCTRPSRRRRSGPTRAESVVADGPFAETKEQLGGIYLIECDTLDQAVDAAKRIPATTVEVRPIVGENDH